MKQSKQENLLLFRSELIDQLTSDSFEGENLATYFSTVGFQILEGGKEYFNYFYYLNQYLTNTSYDRAAFDNAVASYKTQHGLSAEDEAFINASFQINYMIANYWENSLEEIEAKTDEIIELAKAANITEPNTLLSIYRLQLRCLVDMMSNPTVDKREKMIHTKNQVVELMAQAQEVMPNELANTYFFE